jgi:hypothetical protein
MPLGVINPANNCDVCGAANAQIRTITREGCVVNWLSGYTCKECIDVGKERDYVQKMWDTKIAEDNEYNTLVSKLRELDIRTNSDPDPDDVKRITNRLDELDKNQEARDQHAERYHQVILINTADFIGKYGLGVKHKKCEICGQGNSYLCIFEDHYEGCVEIFDELSFWACADCNSNGRQITHRAKILRESIQYWIECDNVKKEYELGAWKSREEMKSYLSTFEHGKELEAQEAKYKSTAKLMRAERLSYQDIPVKMLIKTGGEGDTCFLCSKTIGKDHKCGAD